MDRCSYPAFSASESLENGENTHLTQREWYFTSSEGSSQTNTIFRRIFSNLPPIIFSQPSQNKGIMYVHGRDRYYRPIIVFNAYMLDPKKVQRDFRLQFSPYIGWCWRAYQWPHVFLRIYHCTPSLARSGGKLGFYPRFEQYRHHVTPKDRINSL